MPGKESRIKKGAPAGAPSDEPPTELLAEISVGDLGQIEHGDLALPAEQRTQLLVGIDSPVILRVLQVIPFDVRPQLADDLSPRHGAVAYDGRELRAGLKGSHECGIRRALLTGGGFLSGGFLGGLLTCSGPP